MSFSSFSKTLLVAALFLLVSTPAVFGHPVTDEGVQAGDKTIRAGITPDSPFYFLDTAWDKATLALTFDASAKARKALNVARERLVEMRAMLQDGKSDAAASSRKGHAASLETAESALTKDAPEDSLKKFKERTKIKQELQEHREEIKTVEESVDASGELEKTSEKVSSVEEAVKNQQEQTQSQAAKEILLDPDPAGADEVDTEMVDMNLTGENQKGLEECLQGMPLIHIPGPSNNPEMDDWEEWEQAHRQHIRNYIKENCPEFLQKVKNAQKSKEDKKKNKKEEEKVKTEEEQAKKGERAEPKEPAEEAEKDVTTTCPGDLKEVSLKEAREAGVDNPKASDENGDKHICIKNSGQVVADNSIQKKDSENETQKKEETGTAEEKDAENTKDSENQEEQSTNKKDEEESQEPSEEEKSDSPEGQEPDMEADFSKDMEKLNATVITLCYGEGGLGNAKSITIQKILEKSGVEPGSKEAEKIRDQVNYYWKQRGEAGVTIPARSQGQLYIVKWVVCYDGDGIKPGNDYSDTEQEEQDNDRSQGEKEKLDAHESGHAVVASLVWDFMSCAREACRTAGNWGDSTFENKLRKMIKFASQAYHQKVGKSVEEAQVDSNQEFLEKAAQAVKQLLNNREFVQGEIGNLGSQECYLHCLRQIQDQLNQFLED